MVDPGSGRGDRREITLPWYGAGLSASLSAGRTAGGATGCFEHWGNVFMTLLLGKVRGFARVVGGVHIGSRKDCASAAP